MHNFTEFLSLYYFENLDELYKESIKNKKSGVYLQFPVPEGIIINNQKEEEEKVEEKDYKTKHKFYCQLHTLHNANRLVKVLKCIYLK